MFFLIKKKLNYIKNYIRIISLFCIGRLQSSIFNSLYIYLVVLPYVFLYDVEKLEPNLLFSLIFRVKQLVYVLYADIVTRKH